MIVREATVADADGVSAVLTELVAAGKRSKASDRDFALSHYIADPQRIRCSVAVDEDGTILGFQSLKHARAGNPYDTPIGWGIIGTHVRPSAARRGVGRALFAASAAAARAAGVEKIEAFIGANNPQALTYYEAMGFRTYREPEGVVAKVFVVDGAF
jgi:GNAT superfamily N-acetyltransferase